MTTRSVIDSTSGWINATKQAMDEVMKSRLHFDCDTALADTLAAVPAATDLASSKVLAAALRVAWEAHIASTAMHTVADATNTCTASSTADLAAVEALVTELKGDVNAHIKDAALDWHRNKSWDLVTSADPSTDQTAANLLANELQTKIVAHLRNGMQTLPTCSVPGAAIDS